MPHPSRDEVLAVSAGWAAVLLNVLPGLGAGYLYQRRWTAYWMTSAVAATWFVAGAALGGGVGAGVGAGGSAAETLQNQLIGLIGLVLLSAITATEAGLAVQRVRTRLDSEATAASNPLQ